jgi:hypothetical protein
VNADRAPQLKAVVRRLVKQSMKSLTYENLVPRLIEALPEVPMDPDSVADNLTYLVFNDLMRFVNLTVEVGGDAPILAKIFRFIEEVAGTKDLQVQDVLQDCLYLVAVAPADKARSTWARILRRRFAMSKPRYIKANFQWTAKGFLQDAAEQWLAADAAIASFL